MEVNETNITRAMILTDTLFATKYFFKKRYGQDFIVGNHHVKIAEMLERVFDGEITRLIITLPPRYSKTEMVVKTLIAKGMAINPKSKFIHLSYSENLALDNSAEIRDMIQSDWYRELFPYVKIKRDTDAKQKWQTEAGGGVYATSTAGQVTGFGAGELSDSKADTKQFSGAIIIDDPIKPEDALSAQLRDKINLRFETTVRSRTNSRETPIILIMQRLHQRDMVGYLTEIEPDDWTVLSLPAISTDESGNEVALWEYKHTLSELKSIQKANRFIFETQYQQRPVDITEKLWLFAYDSKRHLGKTSYNDSHPLVMSWDFNRNPMSVSLWQHYDNRIYCIETISIEDATTQTVCKYIGNKYPDAMFLVTGDVSGRSLTTVSLIDNYTIIKNYFGLSKGQMQYSGVNPRLADSRYFVNAMFENYDIIIDADNCKELIFDCENVMSDDENKPIKNSRSKMAERADMLDTLRYYLHRYFRDIVKITN